ncbi:MAG TPA: hypothetical protein PLU30_01765 [Verrucomicrobiae bacterium]|nr:hypothetical protein [Verrucomicrobiae bacterium]
MRSSITFPVVAVLGALLVGVAGARAQRTEAFGISKIEVSYQKMRGGGLSLWPKAKQGIPALRLDEWMEIEVEFRAEPDDVDGDFFDEIEVRIHVLTPEDKKGELKRERITAEMKFSPVPKAKALYAVAYLPPVVLERYGGKSAWENGCNVAAEVFYKGRAVAELELKSKGNRAGDENWYTQAGKKGVLLNRSKTPFALDGWDRYLPEVEPSR